MKNKFRILFVLMLFVLIIALAAFGMGYRIFLKQNVYTGEKKSMLIFIPTHANYDSVETILERNNALLSLKTFRLAAQYKKYDDVTIKPGRYRIRNEMSNNALINMLRAGNQEPLRLTFNNVRTMNDLCSKVAAQLELSADSLCNALMKTKENNNYGISGDAFMTIFIPNTYEMYWNTSAEEFIERMYSEYEKFWSGRRRELAENIPLEPTQVSILASIVQSETNKKDEMSRVAGLYINRLRTGMLLQADPTIKFALQDFGLQRVLFSHLEVDSPYNTYKNSGLPPGPICLPDPSTIDAVLNFERHSFIFMCASSDFSGYHVFARSAAEHARNARAYQQALNQRKIR